MSPFNVLFVSAEASPLAKVGGLGDVTGSLPAVLRKAGHDVRVVLPRYGTLNSGQYRVTWRDSFAMSFMGKSEMIEISEIWLKNGTPVYLVGNERYFHRLAVYGEPDDLDRFLFFSRAAMELPRLLNWKPDIVHSHDWHTGICPALLKVDYRGNPLYRNCASVFTIHNLAYQGWFDDHFIWRGNLYDYLPPLGHPQRSRTYSMMGMGIYHADIITTVSQTYAKEIMTPEYGVGLESLLSSRRDSLRGIINGIDYDEFDPATDPRLARNYDLSSLDKRMKNKLALQEQVGLRVDPDVPLIGMAGRLVHQKGPDIAAEALESLLPHADVQFILQGTGETQYKQLLEKVESFNTRKARLFFVLDFALAQLIYGGCDIFLMPSRFEPCGLAPLIAMHYGAVPVVRRTGGMAETVPDCNADLTQGLGFVFEKYEAGELLGALKRALAAYQDKPKWQALMRRNMSTDFSWQASLPKYEALYKDARKRVTG